MAAIARALRQRIAVLTASRNCYIHNASKKLSKSDLDMERFLRDWRLIIAKDVAKKVEKMTVVHDTNSNPFRRLYENLGIPNNAFKPKRFWRLNLFFVYLLSFKTGVEVGEDHAKSVQTELREIKQEQYRQRKFSNP